MTRTAGLLGLVVLALAAPVAAQTPQPAAAAPQASTAASPEVPESRWSLGVLSGIQVVDHADAIIGGEFSLRARKNVHLVVEWGRFADVVTESRIAEVASYADYIGRTQNRVPGSSIDAPAWFGGVGLRYLYENGSGIRPYVMGTVGLAKVEYRPNFTLDGVDIGRQLSSYGVILGRDLLGPGTHMAYTGGAGLVFGDKWYLDLGARITRINTPEQATDVRRVSISIGRRFQ